MTTHPNDIEDWDLCHQCGGLCCALYLAVDEDGEYNGHGWLPDYIEVWIDRLTTSGALAMDASGEMVAGEAGIEPLHDPRISHLPDARGEAYRATLPGWIDTTKCQFCHPETGCMLPRERRATICGEWVCELWTAKRTQTG